MNPDAAKYDCPDCGKATKVNTRTGRLYSHSPPGETRACPKGGALVATPRGDTSPPRIVEVAQPPKKVKKPPVSAEHRLRGDEESVSIRAILAGLPGLGRRR